MSGVVSFGNIVNSLRSVRNEYNEHLKAVPQYSAFLLVESSTQQVADTLQGLAAAQSMAAEVVEALEAAKAKCRQHLASVPEFRARLAIDKLISDVSADLGLQTVTQPQPEQAAPELNATSASAEPETTAADQVVVAEAAQAVHAEAQPEITSQVETTEQTTVALTATTPPDAQAEQASADAISQVQTALSAPEDSAEVAYSSSSSEPAASAPTDLNPASAVATESHSDSSPPPQTFEAEKAA